MAFSGDRSQVLAAVALHSLISSRKECVVTVGCRWWARGGYASGARTLSSDHLKVRRC